MQALIDPVCLMTCYPDLLHNFVYRQPKWETLFSMIGLMDVLRYVCSRDLLIAEVMPGLCSICLFCVALGTSAQWGMPQAIALQKGQHDTKHVV